MVLVQRFFFFFKWLKGPMPLVQTLSFFFFFWRFGNLDFFFFLDLKKIYIHKQSTSNATCIFRIQRNIEIWNKQTNFKLNHDVTNQMWNEAKLGHLLEPWLWSFGICLKWLELWLWSFGRIEPWLWWNGLSLHLEGMHLVSFGLWCWSCIYTFDGLKWWA